MVDVGSNWNVRRKTGGRVAVPDEVKLAWGQRIRAYREALGMTQDAIADRGGFARPDMSRFEKGEKLSPAANRGKLALGLGISVVELAALIDGKTTAKVLELERKLSARTRLSDERVNPVIAMVAKARDFNPFEVEAATALARGLAEPDMPEDQALELLIEARESRARWMRRYAITAVTLLRERPPKVKLVPTPKDSLSAAPGPARPPRPPAKPTKRERE